MQENRQATVSHKYLSEIQGVRGTTFLIVTPHPSTLHSSCSQTLSLLFFTPKDANFKTHKIVTIFDICASKRDSFKGIWLLCNSPAMHMVAARWFSILRIKTGSKEATYCHVGGLLLCSSCQRSVIEKTYKSYLLLWQTDL